MGTNLKVTLSLGAVALAVLAVALVVDRAGSEDVPASEAAQTVVRPDSHRLSTAADGKVTVVEFLDFECEACGAAYPGVERLRDEYGDRITYVIRYFPIASHPNALNAAHAAEAASRQGGFEQMYVKLFDNQTAWSHREQSQVETLVGYAGELGLDVEKFRADIASPEVDARVRSDAEDGQRIGVRGTPTFFVNGVRYEQDPTYEALKRTIDAALAR
ncbi:thioredoxin domain-containing protein [Plantactinospora sp. S1510]|uniref:Thioredoxin domain-containing protein n=1 Tax=Plantactinospora alkalitolerans TaxID=2789879 RepID=A0ABS0H462_9ACTN|nr:thioredoxin domain-containing protein [Plantactinospora alkalitolerans]